MLTFINGHDGIHSGVGSFGKNASDNVAKFLSVNPGNTNMVVTYTPTENKRLFDAFGFAEREIQRFDCNHDGSLNVSETIALMNHDEKLGSLFLAVLDTDEDMEIGVVDLTAFILFQDDAPNLIRDVVIALKNENQLTYIDPELWEMLQHAESEANGCISPLKAMVADIAVLHLSSVVKMILETIRTRLKLNEKYMAYLQENVSVVSSTL